MTSARDATRTPEAYIGLDFGTSNSAISFVDQNSVKVYRHRSEESRWLEFTELVDTLPYPLADTLARYLGQTESSRLTMAAFEFVEDALALGAYTVYLEYCSQKGRSNSNLFKGLTKRSAGPLWQLIRESITHLGKAPAISAPYRNLLMPDIFKEIDSAITQFSQQKHNKATSESIDHLRLVKILANISAEVFSTVRFGFFEGVKKSRFGVGFRGVFRHAHGKPPFVRVSEYSGDESFSETEAMIVVLRAGLILPLKPLVYWDSCKRHPDLQPPGHCYFYDSTSKAGKEFSYKAVGSPCSLEIAPTDESGPLAELLIALRKSDNGIPPLSGKFTQEE
jgi:hypothetical protein